MKKIILIITGVFIILWGISNLLLPYFGSKTDYIITEVKKDYSRSDSDIYCEYKITYTFNTQRNKEVTESLFDNVTKKSSVVPQVGYKNTVYYYRLLPFINKPTEIGIPVWYDILASLIGIFLIYAALS